ncbi:MAG: hypothetical protein ACYDAR_21055 [Thermomicrobiales bacterium]
MAWYDDKKKTTHVATYKDTDAAEREQREAALKGWTVRETTTAPERVAVGRAITNGLFTAGAGLLKGRPRKGGKVTVTYERTPVSPTQQDA